jgi:hypothetical protein
MTAMLLASINHHDGAGLSDKIYDAPAATPTLLREIIDATCPRLRSPGQRPRTARIERLLDAGALAEAALELIDLELPQWQLRRIAYDGGDWYCALSRARELPDWLDQPVEAWHHDLALAILAAFVKAQGASSLKSRASVPSSPREANARDIAMCCDNFA